MNIHIYACGEAGQKRRKIDLLRVDLNYWSVARDTRGLILL